MLEILLFATIVILVLLMASSDIVLTFILQHTLEPAIRWIQKHILGIDAVRAGAETLIGSRAVSGGFSDAKNGEFVGAVSVEGETWQAVSKCRIAKGDPVLIVGRKKLVLSVEPHT